MRGLSAGRMFQQGNVMAFGGIHRCLRGVGAIGAVGCFLVSAMIPALNICSADTSCSNACTVHLHSWDSVLMCRAWYVAWTSCRSSASTVEFMRQPRLARRAAGYYSSLLGQALYYFFASLQWPLPWVRRYLAQQGLHKDLCVACEWQGSPQVGPQMDVHVLSVSAS